MNLATSLLRSRLTLIGLGLLVPLAGCNDSTEPPVTAVDLVVTAEPAEVPGDIDVRAVLKNVGAEPVEAMGQGILIRFNLYDGSGAEVHYRNPCWEAFVDPAPVNRILAPGEAYTQETRISAVRWETTPLLDFFECTAVPLEAGEYRIEGTVRYQGEGVDEYYTLQGEPVFLDWAGEEAP